MKENHFQESLFPKSREEIIEEILHQHKLPLAYRNTFEIYLRGDRPVHSLVCCHSGCRICQEDVYQAILTAKKHPELREVL